MNSDDLRWPQALIMLAAPTNKEPLVEYLVTGLQQLARAGADFELRAANTVPHIVGVNCHPFGAPGPAERT